ncbi:unnamed protein product [Adineta ricciae]|uniref:N-acetyltransferase domain-containing protein n=1 Tax=Adineta ricciae TaxID=249248 RepID=A0A814AG24_ADIRI|nr:unnamed protein product [Adineta ricciae]CAF1188775.1 unnamed protein product [Adineta ricciae]
MANTIEDDGTYSYEVLLEKDLEEVARLLARTFTEGNPLEIYLKTAYEQFYPYALAVSKAILQDQLSIIAVHKQTREIHGIVQAADAKTMAKQNFEDVDPSIDTLRALQEIEEHFMNQYGEFNENDLVQILMVGIRQDCSGKGLATKLHEILFARCRQHAFRHVFVEVANPATHYIYTKKLNGKEFASTSLATFVSNDGRRPFEHFDGKIQLIVFDL